MARISLLLLGIIVVLTCSCASLFSEREYVIRVETVPSGADVRVNRRYGRSLAEFKSPGSFDIHYGEDIPAFEDDLRMTVTRPGCKERRLRVGKSLDLMSLWNIPIWPAFFIDLYRGNMWKPAQEEYLIRLDPEGPGQCRPDAVPAKTSDKPGAAEQPAGDGNQGQPAGTTTTTGASKPAESKPTEQQPPIRHKKPKNTSADTKK